MVPPGPIPVSPKPAPPPPPKAPPGQILQVGPAKIELVRKGGPVESRLVSQALSKLKAELEDKFGNNVVKKLTTIKLYVVGGGELTDEDRSFFIAQGFSAEKLDETFAQGGRIHGLANLSNNIIIIPADKAISQGEFGFSNILKHEVGHQLIGVQCSGHPDTHECGGVMVAEPSARVDLGYTDQFRDTVIEIHQNVVAEAVRYTSAWGPSPEDEIQIYGVSYEAYRAEYDRLWEQGWRLKLLSPYVFNGEVRYTAVWQPSRESEIQIYGATYQEYRAQYDELWNQGWRLKLLSPYVFNGEVRYTAVWQSSRESEIQIYGVSYEAYRAEYDRLWEQGWRLKLLNPYACTRC